MSSLEDSIKGAVEGQSIVPKFISVSGQRNSKAIFFSLTANIIIMELSTEDVKKQWHIHRYYLTDC